MRGRLDARRTLKSLVADLRDNENVIPFNKINNFFVKYLNEIDK